MEHPIHTAARNADVDAIRRLIGEGVSPMASDGLTPLQYLCCAPDRLRGDADNRVACFNILVDAGADINAGINTPLSLAARQGHPKLVAALINAGANVNCTRRRIRVPRGRLLSIHVLMDNRGIYTRSGD